MELKVDSELSALQEYNILKIIKAKGIALEVTPQNWNDVKNVLVNLVKGAADD